MSLANLIALVSSAHIDPTTAPECDTSPEVVETVIGRNLPKPVRGKIPAITSDSSGDGSQAAPIHNGPKPTVVQHETPKLDAKAFIIAMRKAKTRDESIAAIVGYTGLTWHFVSCDFGNQDREARAKAGRELSARPIVLGPSREEQRAAARSMTGYIHGMPQHDRKMLANLKAREQSAAEAMIDAKTPEEKAAAEANLKLVREAISQLGG